MLRHQRTSYGRILSQAFDTPPEKPLFDTIVNYQDFSSFDMSGAEVFWYPAPSQLETLQINIMSLNGTFQIHYDYRPDSLSENAVKQFHARVKAVLEEIVQGNSKAKTAELSQVPEEQKKIIAQWNHTEYAFPNEETLYTLFEKQAAQRSDQIALIFGDQRLTYGEFLNRIRILARKLVSLHVKRGDIVGVMADRSFDMMVAIYAVLHCGAAYMPIAVDIPPDRARFMLEDSGSPVLLTQSSIHFEVPQCVRRVDVDQENWTDDAAQSPSLAGPEDVAYVIYTSGSTGAPKGAMVRHRNIVDRIHWMHRTFGLIEDDCILQKTPYTFDVSVWELFWWSGYGGRLCIMPPEAHKDPEQIIEHIEKYHITKMHFVPSMLSAFLAYVEAADCMGRLSSLVQVFASGEALMPAHVLKFYRLIPGAELVNLYGPTECTVDVSCFRCPREALDSIPIGRPVDNTQLHVLDAQLRPLPIGAQGELCVTGNLVGAGYLNRQELTEERFVRNPFGEGKMYRTGDLVYWNENGEIEYIGRMDFQVKLRGQRLELGEIERRMAEIPDVEEAVALVQQSGEDNAQLVACYTGKRALPAGKLRDELKKYLPDYMIPQGFLYLKAMPLNANGKLDRKQIPHIRVELDCSDALPLRRPVSEAQKDVCAAYAKVLQIPEEDVGLDTHFFEQGGTSLRAILLMTVLLDKYQLQIRDIYDHPTPEKLAAFLTKDVDLEKEVPDYEADRLYFHIDLAEQANPGMNDWAMITGTTGFLGVHLLKELLERHPQTSFFCLVRNEEKLIQHWNCMFDEPYPQERIRAVVGDISKDGLGLSVEDMQLCRAKASAVFHCAADVRHFGQWEASYAVNTLGTERIVNFCLETGAVLHHVSTMSVNGYVLTGMNELLSDEFAEDNLYIGQRYRENVYVHSKYLAEKIILDARDKGLKCNIYRIGNLLWRARDGKFQKNREAHDFYMLTHAFIELKADAAEFANLAVDMTAVDSCAAAIATLASGVLGQVYHLVNPYTVTLHEYLENLTEYEIETLPMKQFMKICRAHAKDPNFGFLLAYMTANEQMNAKMFPRESFHRTVQALKKMGFEWEKPTVQYARYVL